MTNVLGPLHPDFLFINQGYWSDDQLRNNHTYTKLFVATTKKVSKRAVWKTSTATRGGADQMDPSDFLDKLREEKMEIFDVYSLTAGIATENKYFPLNITFWDDKHFYPFVYREINKQLVHFINSNKAVHEK